MPKFIPAFFTLTTLWWATASPLPAETIYALNSLPNTDRPDLFSFDSAMPGVITTPTPITGLTNYEALFEIAIRPADRQLYGLSSSGNIYRIDPTTAAATLVFYSPLLGARTANMAFDPVTDQLRVITPLGETQSRSFRVNVDTGAVVQDGIFYNYFRGLAFTNSYAGANTTAAYIQSGSGLSVSDPENLSQSKYIGSLGVSGVLNSFGISGVTGTAYAAFAFGRYVQGPEYSQLYTVDLNTGAGTLVGSIGNGPLFVFSIAAPVGPAQVAPVPEPASWGLLGAGLLLGGTFWRLRLRPAQNK